MDYEMWEREAALLFGRDRMWDLKVYRRALYLSDMSMPELLRVARVPGLRKSADQLIEAIGSIRANLTEGYGRISAVERARYYEMSLASARESRDWYLGFRDALTPTLVQARAAQLGEIIAMLTGLVNSQRKKIRRR